MVDFHTHSIHSVDGHDTVLDMCESAVQKGISHLAITDHCDFGTNSVDKLGWFRYVADSENLQEKFQIAKQRYNGKLELLFGVEFGNAKWHPLICQYLTKKNHYDFILGAVHNVRHGRNIYRINFSEPKLLELCWKEYFDELDYIVNRSEFDSLAHLDYPLRVMEKAMPEDSIRRYAYRVEPILKKLAEREKALEINTHGVTHWEGRVGPEPWVLEMFRSLGGKYVTIGSDSHTAGGLASGFNEAVRVLKAAGFDTLTIYQKREPESIPLTEYL